MNEEISPFDFDSLVNRALRAIAADALRRTMLRGALPDDHHFHITFDTTFPSVEMPEPLRRRFAGDITITIQHQFSNLEVDHESFAVTLSFSGELQRIRIPFLSLKSFIDPSCDFALAFSPADISQADVDIELCGYCREALSVLGPIERIDYETGVDRVMRAALIWLCGNMERVVPHINNFAAELTFDSNIPSSLYPFNISENVNEIVARLHGSFKPTIITGVDFCLEFDSEAILVPLVAIQSVKFFPVDIPEIVFGKAGPDYFADRTDTNTARLRLSANRSFRAIMVFSIKMISQLEQLPKGHHFRVTFATKFSGVKIPPSLVDRYPDHMSIAFQHQFYDLVCHEDAFSVTVFFSGVPTQLHIPYLSVTEFADLGQDYEYKFPREDESSVKQAGQTLMAALNSLERAKETKTLYYPYLEAVASQAAMLDFATSQFEFQEGESIVVELKDEPRPFGLKQRGARLAAEGFALDYDQDHQKIILHRENGIEQFPVARVLKLRATFEGTEFSISLDDDFDVPLLDLTNQISVGTINSKNAELVEKYVSINGHNVHKFKAMDLKGRWIHYFLLVFPRREREFLDAFDRMTAVELLDFGKLIEFCYEDQTNQEVKERLWEKYGFVV